MGLRASRCCAGSQQVPGAKRPTSVTRLRNTMPSTQIEEGPQQIAPHDERVRRGVQHGDVDRVMRFCGDTYVDPNLRNPVQSWKEPRQYFTQVVRNRGVHVRVQPDEILIRGEFAFIRARSNSQLVISDRRESGNFPTAAGGFLAGDVGPMQINVQRSRLQSFPRLVCEHLFAYS